MSSSLSDEQQQQQQQQQHSNHDEEETPSSTEEGDETSTTTITANTTSATTAAYTSTNTTTAIISKNDLMELIKAVKFANPDYSQRDVYKEIVNEIPIKFPQYSSSVNDTTITLNDIKKVWKKAVLLPLQQQQNQSDNNNNDLAERLRKMNTTPEVYTIGVSSGVGSGSGTGSSSSTETTTSASAAKDYIELYLKQLLVEEKEKSRLILQDYVHVFLDVPADSSGSKPHQALINFQQPTKTKSSSSITTSSENKKKTTGGSKGNKKKGGNRGKKTTTAATATAVVVAVESSPTPSPLPFDDAIIIKIQMAAPLTNDENEISIKHPMLLYDKERKYKTFIHPNSTLTSTSTSDHNLEEESTNNNNKNDSNNNDDGYTKISNWINTNGIGGVLGSSGGTKAYFYSRLTEIETSSNGNGQQRILSIYVKELAPSKQEW
ncbi:hypothetical protein FRACYDRAFT_240804 [Fragilariopsis cylindrus CCMP1102]|uniref:Uncharacterized protein n=1 Tax=Fragilariopsis cylindrus CCMP1102 TaxID=635003 RepID=A0A1E7F7X7_9STRA|nr:hypothetical protein FRACYDRAFT_240804 [Fragilariopsis cylindrus CCMP1102]|eukprot:OEU14270.1 hypothetical protein FRACYDRAFT_240804 [Fragilariopsis cylindrus CCMP1102]